MSSSMTFNQFLDNLNTIFIEYKELPQQKSKYNQDGFFKRNIKKITNLFADQTELNSPGNLIENEISTREFIEKCIQIIQPHLEKSIKGESLHSQWEQEAFLKLEELMKINSFTNKKKHIEIIKLLQGEQESRVSQKEYFRRFVEKEENKEEKEILSDIEDYNRILEIMEVRGMPLSLNEKINILEGKIGYWNGIMLTLQEKKKE